MATAAPAPARRSAPRRRALRPHRAPARRVSGRALPPRSRHAVALPAGARVLDALLTGRVWIALVGVLLAGIVFFNVDLLQMNREITRMADRAAQLKRHNARLRLDVARLASSERIQEAAAQLGLVFPAPDEVRYRQSNPRIDARNASKRIIAPDPAYVPADATTPEPDPSAVTTTTTTPPTATTPTAPTESTAGVPPATGAVE
jgi:cell division protein FtsL